MANTPLNVSPDAIAVVDGIRRSLELHRRFFDSLKQRTPPGKLPVLSAVLRQISDIAESFETALEEMARFEGDDKEAIRRELPAVQQLYLDVAASALLSPTWLQVYYIDQMPSPKEG